jgi:hypothetical protein
VKRWAVIAALDQWVVDNYWSIDKSHKAFDAST